jgi:hypothetical protein
VLPRLRCSPAQRSIRLTCGNASRQSPTTPVVRCGENFPYGFKGASGASRGRPGSVLSAQLAATPERRPVRASRRYRPGGGHSAVTGRQRCRALSGGSPTGAAAAAGNAGPYPAVTGAPPSAGCRACKSGRPSPSRRASCHRAKITVKGAPAARRCALAQAPPLEQ